jgi:hypothetical protein
MGRIIEGFARGRDGARRPFETHGRGAPPAMFISPDVSWR